MAPNSKPQIEPSLTAVEAAAEKVQEILCDGYFYDVTNFVRRHPGGSIIEYYTQHGEDATIAIQQFHQRSPKKVSAILSSFKKRKAEERESKLRNSIWLVWYLIKIKIGESFWEKTVQPTPEKARRHLALNEDFTKLYLELEKEGMFEPAYLHNFLRILEIIGIALLGYFCLFSGSYLVKFFGVVLIALAQGRSGWMQHESGHRSLTGKPNADRCLHAVIFGKEKKLLCSDDSESRWDLSNAGVFHDL